MISSYFLNENNCRGKELHGELLVKGSCVMQGYWRHKDESAKSIIDGWLHTGDLGFMQDGYLFLTGRQSNLLALKGGEKVHAEHIENILKNIPLIKEVMIIGEQCKRVYALVNVEENELSDPKFELKELIAEAVKNLAAYQKPKDLLILPDFSIDAGTMTPTLKIRRRQIMIQFQEQINQFLTQHGENLR